jgi:hypothetical protein
MSEFLEIEIKEDSPDKVAVLNEQGTPSKYSVVCFSGKYMLVQADIADFLAEFWGKVESLIVEIEVA